MVQLTDMLKKYLRFTRSSNTTARKTNISIVALVFIYSNVSLAEAQSCEGDAGVAIARAYAIAVSWPIVSQSS